MKDLSPQRQNRGRTTMNKEKILVAVFAAGIICILIGVFYAMNYSYQQGIQSTQQQISGQNGQINRLERPQVLLITSSFIGYNLTGIVFNEGYSTAHNVRVSVGYGYQTIYLGNIGSQTSVSFNQYIPPPQGQLYPMYNIEILWNEKAPDQY